MHFLNEYTMTFDGTPVIMEAKCVPGWILVVIEDKLLSNQTARVKANPKLVR